MIAQPLSGVFYSEAPTTNIVQLPIEFTEWDKHQKVVAAGWTWLRPWLDARYSGLTLKAYQKYWDHFLAFFHEKRIHVPQRLTRAYCFEYVIWRMAQGCGRNTVKKELLFLSLACKEALERGLIRKNPASALGIRKLPTKVKPEITAAMEAEIRNLIETGEKFPERTWRDFFRISFELGLRHGCRIAETRLPLSDIELGDKPRITFLRKGSKEHTVPLHPALVPMITKLKDAGKRWTYEEPENPKMTSALWHHLYHMRGFRKRYPNLCFHSCRVTCASRLARAGVPMIQAMRYIYHADEEIHKIYLRVQTDDLSRCVAAL